MLNLIRDQLREWLFPGLALELSNLAMSQEAMFDIHALNLLMTPEIWDHALMNAHEYNELLISGEATLNDRFESLLEVLRRSKLISEAQ
jgi:hypothetical protein